MTNKVLQLFANTLTSDDKYYLLNRDNLMQPIQMHFSEKQKTFDNFFVAFSNLYQIWNFLKKMTLVAYVLPILRTTKDVVR